MNLSKAASSTSDQYSTYALLRRLLVDEALGHWPRYAVALVLAAVVAGATALSVYLLGTIINAAYVDKNYHEIVAVGLLSMLIFVVRALATYGSAVMLSWIGNRIVADNQRRMFDKLLHENIGYFADRHSSEFVSRLTTGAAGRQSGDQHFGHGFRPRSDVADRSDHVSW